jgi:hypothetical protein
MFVVLRNSAPYYSMYDNETQLKDDLVVFLDLYREKFGYSHINYRDFNIDEIVSFSMEVGQEVINHNLNYGIIQIIKGTPFQGVPFNDDDDENIDDVSTSSTLSTEIWDLPEIQMNNIHSVPGTPYETPLETIPTNVVEPVIILESREMDDE